MPLELGGVPVRFCKQGRALWLEFAAPCLRAVCGKIMEGLIPEKVRNSRQASSQKEVSSGAIVWSAARNSYIVTYQEAGGTRRQTSCGLAVPTKSKTNKVLSPEAVASATRHNFTEAQVLWSRMDRSSRPRFGLPSSTSTLFESAYSP